MPLLAVTLLLAPAVVSRCSDESPTPAEAIEKARALEKSGLPDEAFLYLSPLIEPESGDLARNAEVILEAARLAPSVPTTQELAARAIERTRNSSIIHAAHMMLGESLYAQRLYGAAASHFFEAARHSDRRGPGAADLRYADCLLASGDAVSAVEAFREAAESGAVPGPTSSLAQLGLGRSLLAAGRAAEAAEEFERAVRTLSDESAKARGLAGAAEAYEAAGDDQSARKALEALVDEHPGSYEAVLARNKLRAYAAADTTAPADTLAPPSVGHGRDSR